MTLSDKEQYVRNEKKNRGFLGFRTCDVKDFIKKIKDKLCCEEVNDVIDKEAGEELR